MRLSNFALLLLAVACNKPADKGAAASASAAASGSAAASATAAKPSGSAEAVKGEKLDVEALKKALRCGKSDGPCAVLGEFKDCADWNPVVPSGDGRWLGRGYRTKNGAFVEELTILRSKSIPKSEVGGALPTKIAIEVIPDDRAERNNAEKAIRAFERGDVALPGNTALTYIKERADWADAPVLGAPDNQIQVATGGGAHLCSAKGNRLVLVAKALGASHPADAVYAILYPVKW